MPSSLSAAARFFSISIVAAFAVADPAIAGMTPVPGPILGAGAPVLAAFAVGYYLIRKRRAG